VAERTRLVLLVGGDDETAKAVARASTPLPVVRAKIAAHATERLRAMRPLAVVIAADVPKEDAAELRRAARAQAAAWIEADGDLQQVAEVVRRR